MPFRVAADVLRHLLPADVGISPETLRAHTLKFAEQLCNMPTTKPVAAAMSITVTTDSTFIRSCEEGNRHLEVRVGNVETSDGGRQVFGAVARSDTDIAVRIRRSLEAVGRTAATKMTAFTDGCPGLRSILADAGVTTRPIADWFHIAMRLQHAKLAASGLLTDEPGRTQAKTTIVTEVERLHWRIWNGKAKVPRRPSIASARSCISTRVGAVIEPEVWHPENCGKRFTRSTDISVARAPSWSTMPLDTALACASGLR